MPPGSLGAAFGNKNRMKMTKTKKLIALALSVVMIAAFLTGCSIFEYNEDSDMEQPILEISSFTYEYEVPVIEDYEDIYGNKVYEVNTDPDSDGYGQTTDEVVPRTPITTKKTTRSDASISRRNIASTALSAAP